MKSPIRIIGLQLRSLIQHIVPPSRAVAGMVALIIGLSAMTASAATLHWVGGDGDWDTTTANWLDGATPTTFSNGDDVIFDNTAGGNITLIGTVEPASTTFSAASGNYTITTNGTNSGEIGGSGSLTQSGSGITYILNVNNSYSGGTVIDAGTLKAGATTFNDALGPGIVTLNNGTLFLFRFWPTNALVVNGGTIYSDNGFGNNWYGPVTLNGEPTVKVKYKLTFSGNISGVGGLLVDYGSPRDDWVALSGSNTYSGVTTVKTSTLRVYGNSISDGSNLIIDGGKVEPMANKTVKDLWFGAAKQVKGLTYGATGSGADVIDDTRFIGTAGVIKVRPSPGTVFSIR